MGVGILIYGIDPGETGRVAEIFIFDGAVQVISLLTIDEYAKMPFTDGKHTFIENVSTSKNLKLVFNYGYVWGLASAKKAVIHGLTPGQWQKCIRSLVDDPTGKPKQDARLFVRHNLKCKQELTQDSVDAICIAIAGAIINKLFTPGESTNSHGKPHNKTHNRKYQPT